MLEATVKSLPKYPSMVLALAGDSTITRFFDMPMVQFKGFKYQEFFKKSKFSATATTPKGPLTVNSDKRFRAIISAGIPFFDDSGF
jgi:hypothetical protein